MSDQKLRDLERRWKETGTVEDEAAYLLERVRVGDLTRERLELAAYCGHEGAQKATGRETGLLDAYEWTRELAEWGPQAFVRAAIAASSTALPRLSGALPADNRPGRAVEAAESWLLCPCAAHADLALAASREAHRAKEGTSDLNVRACIEAAAYTARAASSAASDPSTSLDAASMATALAAAGGSLYVPDAADPAVHLFAVRTAARRSILEWLGLTVPAIRP